VFAVKIMNTCEIAMNTFFKLRALLNGVCCESVDGAQTTGVENCFIAFKNFSQAMSAQNNEHVSSFSLPAEGPFAIFAGFPQILNPF
jgi:hypothetical protein